MTAAALSVTGNDRIKPGGNMSPFEASREEIEALYEEARNWADGDPVTTQEVHDEIEKLMGLINDAVKLADKRREEEVKPLNEAKDEIQSRYNTLIGKTKSVTGKGVLALDVLKKAVEPYRIEQARLRAEAAERARKEAEEERRKAEEMIRASAGDLEAREQAEEQLDLAKEAEKFARHQDKQASTGTGLVTYWQTVVTDKRAIAAHYWKTKPDTVDAFFLSLAEADVRAGVRSIPGCEITEQKKARL